MLEEKSVYLENLTTLSMTSFEILRTPMVVVSPRKTGGNYLTSSSCATLPMLSEEDLVGSSIDINIDHYMDASDGSDPSSASKFVFMSFCICIPKYLNGKPFHVSSAHQ